MVRHVNSRLTDMYWKESYRCLRKWHPTIPILIIDDSSNRQFLTEDIVLTNCTVIYDLTHKGSAELLPYYYFHLLHPFEIAVIIHDSFFLQSIFDPTLLDDEQMRFLWSFGHNCDDGIKDDMITPICRILPHGPELVSLFDSMSGWNGCFGVMSIIRWNFVDHLNQVENNLFERWLTVINTRVRRSGLERVLAMLAFMNNGIKRSAVYGNIQHYIRWGTTFGEYLNGTGQSLPVMKVWTGR